MSEQNGMSEQKIPSILLITSFDTIKRGNVYDNLYINNGYAVEYYSYTSNTSIQRIEDEISLKILKGKYSIIVGHGLGCYFISKTLYANPKLEKQLIVFINPFICNTLTTRLLSYIHPFVANIPVLKSVAFPQCSLTFCKTPLDLISNNNTLNINAIADTVTEYVNLQLIINAARRMETEKFIKAYTKHCVSVIYSTHDTITFIPSEIRKKISDNCDSFVEIMGKHEPFNDTTAIRNNFSSALNKIFTKYDTYITK